MSGSTLLLVDLPVSYQREMGSITTLSCPAKSPRPSTAVVGPFCAKHKDYSSNDVKTILARDLAVKLDSCRGSKSVLLLDVRPFIAYNLNHINGALNISCCDRFTKRKLERGKTSIGDLVSGQENAKNIFKEYLKGSDIVLYDENTTDIRELPSSNPLSLVLSSLVKDGHDVFILKGTF